jgi:hypothetical protein
MNNMAPLFSDSARFADNTTMASSQPYAAAPSNTGWVFSRYPPPAHGQNPPSQGWSKTATQPLNNMSFAGAAIPNVVGGLSPPRFFFGNSAHVPGKSEEPAMSTVKAVLYLRSISLTFTLQAQCQHIAPVVMIRSSNPVLVLLLRSEILRLLLRVRLMETRRMNCRSSPGSSMR